jgi:hypothetical protein
VPANPHPFRVAVERDDLDALRETLREDVVLHSPVLFRPFEGRDAALHVIGAVKEVLTDFRYLAEVGEDGTVVLRFAARIGELEIEGIDLLTLDDDGKVSDLTVFMRPLRALTQFQQAMAEQLGVAS